MFFSRACSQQYTGLETMSSIIAMARRASLDIPPCSQEFFTVCAGIFLTRTCLTTPHCRRVDHRTHLKESALTAKMIHTQQFPSSNLIAKELLGTLTGIMCNLEIMVYAGCGHEILRWRIYCVPHRNDVDAGIAGLDDGCMYTEELPDNSPFADEVVHYGDEMTLCPPCEIAARRRKRKAGDTQEGSPPKRTRGGIS